MSSGGVSARAQWRHGEGEYGPAGSTAFVSTSCALRREARAVWDRPAGGMARLKLDVGAMVVTVRRRCEDIREVLGYGFGSSLFSILNTCVASWPLMLGIAGVLRWLAEAEQTASVSAQRSESCSLPNNGQHLIGTETVVVSHELRVSGKMNSVWHSMTENWWLADQEMVLL
jgi:hypothetical protein